MMHLKGMTAVVTGGAQGIGKAITQSFLEHGCRVLIADVNGEAAAETAGELRARGEVDFIAADAGKESDVRAVAEKLRQGFGTLDILVNNAGIFIGEDIPVAALTLEQWNRVIAVNLTAAFLCTRYLSPLMAGRKGVIINIASTRALMSEKNTEAYSASKGGIVALTHALAISLGPDVRVNCVSPGWIATEDWKMKRLRREPALREEDHRQHPAGRVGTPGDVARVVAFLADPENDFITGANFVVDGGMTRKMIYIP